MEKRLDKSGLRLSAGFLCLLMLFGASDSYAKSSLKKTPLYKHLVKRRNPQPVRLYEKEPVKSGKQEKVAAKSSDEKIEISAKARSAEVIKRAGLERPRRRPVARMRPANLADPSTLTRDMPFSEAVDILRNSTFPRTNIAVLWKDLEENADIYPDTPIGIDGLSGVSLGRHLRSLVDGVSGGAIEKLGYVVDEGVVVISTRGNLPRKMVTRVYDITDLVGEPANYGGMRGIMMNRMVGMMSSGRGGIGGGMMGGGMMGSGIMQGGFGTSYGGGLGTQGGMMGGFGGSYGGFGGGYGGVGGGYGNLGGGYNVNPGLGLIDVINAPYRPLR